jgi:LAO/AO transport system kinase
MSLQEALLAGDRLALSRFLTQVENGEPQAQTVLDSLYPYSGQAHRIGITGAPGTGKSSLVNRLAQQIRADSGRRVAIVAVDPSSPFSGGAILGDRVRMRDLSGDTGVFIRSMASRGAVGGLALATARVVQVFDAIGYDVVLIETVGAGQSEIEIARLAHTTLVVEAPGFGDDIQAIKAGIMEIADILVINKADLPGVENTEHALRMNLDMGYAEAGHHGAGALTPYEEGTSVPASLWVPPIIRTIATQTEGIAALLNSIAEHFQYLKQSGRLGEIERERLSVEINRLLQQRLVERWQRGQKPDAVAAALEKVISREWSPSQAVDWLLNPE